MKSVYAKYSGRRGAALAMALIVMLLLSILGVGLLKRAQSVGVDTSHTVGAAQAFWTAEAGLEHFKALAQMKRLPCTAIPSPTSSTGWLWGTNALSGATTNGAYTVDVLDDATWTNAVHIVKKYVIHAHGTARSGDTRTVTISTVIQSFASYMHASVSENGVNFLPGDVLDGPVYSNDQLSLIGGSPADPLFKQQVSSAASSVRYSSGANSSDFQGGLTLNATPLDIAGQFSSDHILDVKNQAQAGGLVITNSGTIAFNFRQDGSFTYQPLPAGALKTNMLSALNGTIFAMGNISNLQGVVSGKVTLASAGAIYITSNLVYHTATNPIPWATNFDVTRVTDALGLVASNQVMVMGGTNITIDAAILITSGGFNALSNNTKMTPQPYINLFGGSSQYVRGIVSHSGGYGFLKQYKFDTRFQTDAPPGFPYSLYQYYAWTQFATGP